MSIEMTSAAQAQSDGEALAADLTGRERTDEERRAYALQVAFDRAKEVGNSNHALEITSLLKDAGRITIWLRDGV